MPYIFADVGHTDTIAKNNVRIVTQTIIYNQKPSSYCIKRTHRDSSVKSSSTSTERCLNRCHFYPDIPVCVRLWWVKDYDNNIILHFISVNFYDSIISRGLLYDSFATENHS